MLSMKTKKPMKPMVVIAEMIDDAGLSSPKDFSALSWSVENLVNNRTSPVSC